MAITMAESLAKERERLRDTKVPYEFSDDLLASYREPALLEIEQAIREIDPGYFRTHKTVLAYTDAIDPGTYEFYPLPNDMRALEWIERADGSAHYKILDPGAYSQEEFRYSGLFTGTITDIQVGVTTAVPQVGGVESAVVYGSDRFRVVPPPTAAGAQYGIVYHRKIRIPKGSNEPLDLPDAFQEALIKSVRWRALDDEGGETAAVAERAKKIEIVNAKKLHRGRVRTRVAMRGAI